jgi:hypothetical protein
MVISGHQTRKWEARLAIFAIVNNHVRLSKNWRLGGNKIVKHQGMEVMVGYLSLSNRLRTITLLDICRDWKTPSLSWPDNSFRPRSQVVLFGSGSIVLSVQSGGRKDVREHEEWVQGQTGQVWASWQSVSSWGCGSCQTREMWPEKFQRWPTLLDEGVVGLWLTCLPAGLQSIWIAISPG